MLRRSQARLALVLGIAGTAVLAAAVLLGREWILDQYGLLRLPHLSPKEREPIIARLLEHGRPAVTPFLLQYYRENPIEGSIGMTGVAHDGRTSALISLGPGAIPYLAEGLGIDAGLDWDILDALKSHGPRAGPAVPALIEFLHKRDSFLGEAMEVLGAIGEEARPATQALLTFQRSRSDLLRWDLYKALGLMGRGAREAVPLLLDALTFETGEQLVRAAEALERIEPGRPEALQGLLAALRDQDQWGRTYGAEVLPALGPRARVAVPRLVEMVREGPESGVVQAAAAALDALDPARGLETALALAGGTSGEARLRGAIALGAALSRAEEAIEPLIRLTSDADEETARSALASLGSLGRAAAPAIPRLIEVCRTGGSDELRRAAAGALGAIGIASPTILETFRSMLPDIPGDGTRAVAQAIAMLAKVNGEARAVVTMLTSALVLDRATRLGAIEALSWIGPAAGAAAPSLEEIARDSGDREAASEARYALTRIKSKRRP